MEYKYITEYDSPNFGYPDGKRGQNKPEKIVIHHWGNDESTFMGTLNWLCNPESQVSAHFVVEAGRSACLVNWNDAAWHAGDRETNKSSIGIECHPRCSYADMVEVAKVIAMLWSAYGKLPLIGHKDVVATACPGRWYGKLDELKEMAEVIYSGGELPGSEEKHLVVLGEYNTIKEADASLGNFQKLLGEAQVSLSQLDAVMRKAKIVEG